MPNNDKLKTRLPSGNPDLDSHIRKLKASLKKKLWDISQVKHEIASPQQKALDRKANARTFDAKDLVYLYYPAMKSGLTGKFYSPLAGPYKIRKIISELKYQIISQSPKKQVFHINSLKKCYNKSLWKSKVEQKTRKKSPKRSAKHLEQNEENEFEFGPFPLKITEDLNNPTKRYILPEQIFYTPNPIQWTFDIPSCDHADPNYSPKDTPRTRRELQVTRTDRRITSTRARIMFQEHLNTQPP